MAAKSALRLRLEEFYETASVGHMMFVTEEDFRSPPRDPVSGLLSLANLVGGVEWINVHRNKVTGQMFVTRISDKPKWVRRKKRETRIAAPSITTKRRERREMRAQGKVRTPA